MQLQYQPCLCPAALLPCCLSALQLTIEALFLEAAGQLVGASPACLSTQQAGDLEAVAFDWLLGADAYLAYPDPYHHKDRVGAAWGHELS